MLEGKGDGWKLKWKRGRDKKDFLYIHMSVCCLKKQGGKNWSYIEYSEQDIIYTAEKHTFERLSKLDQYLLSEV